MAADFNLPPAVLPKIGWLQLVNGQAYAAGQPTRKSVEDDYFFADRRLSSSALGVALVNDAECKPRSAVRLWLKGRPRRDAVRELKAPSKGEAQLPSGREPLHAGQVWKRIADCDAVDRQASLSCTTGSWSMGE